jgi:hypothetical protein
MHLFLQFDISIIISFHCQQSNPSGSDIRSSSKLIQQREWITRMSDIGRWIIEYQ